MFKLTNYINGFILIILIILVIHFNSFKTISTQLQSILPNNEQKELLQKFNEFQSTKKVLLYVDGLEKESLEKIKNLENELVKIDGLKQEKNQVNKNLQKYKEDYKFYIGNINTKNLENLDIDSKIEQLKSNLLNSNFAYFFDKNDPLGLLERNENLKNFSLKDGHLIIKDLGYFSIFTIDSSINSLSKYETLYDAIHSKITIDENIKLFSPIFYFVENSRMIKKDVDNITIIATLFLFLLYIIILRNIKLLTNTLITLASSILLSLLICSFIFDELSIFIMAFGISISTVAIDYMFLHYVYNHYQEKKDFRKDVFLGMFATVGAFFIISFISFELIKQICYFAIISLVFSYIQFTFLYPKIGFTQKNVKTINFISIGNIKPIIIIVLSFVLIALSINKLEFDSNLRNLDVENKKLYELENFFTTKLTNQDTIPILIKGKTIDSLIENSKILKNQAPDSYIPLSNLINNKAFIERKEFLEKIKIDDIKSHLEKRSLELGFKENFFQKAYIYNIEEPIYTKENITNLGLEILSHKEYFISYANIPKDKAEEFYKYDFVENLSLKTIFENYLISLKNELIWYGVFTILFIITIVLLFTKKNYLTSLSYIIFPFSLILSLSFFMHFNILHLFMLFIILSISIDYGIYMGSDRITQEVYKGILYSLLSAFAGFGVLIFSNINALFSLGIVAITGIIAISILLIILKRTTYDSKSI